ncbi:hypothetical protein LOTGIDRAFT_139716 [Lottia gigantea]|uniref:Protein-tyrosine sulfotransferase n=1 Tax=Lottia gigantea TaxID=225164 RepID=V4ABY0_LOTGI|nr:hypothetical protein LOTGIDRAFT_139716 [Lottia gigantea]ESP01489.1 hypothetical protein LOTGIDRAFT_139716 [Lottia gigantea]
MFYLCVWTRVQINLNVPVGAQSPLFFIGGVPRSGTTLLRVMLDSHPDIRIGPETHIIPQFLRQREAWECSPDYLEQLAEAGISTSVMDSAVQKFILEIMTSHGYPAKYIGDKDPLNLKYMVYLKHLFPNSKFILMLRDGRAVVHSLMTRGVTVRGFNIHNQTDCLINWNKLVGEMYAQCVRLGPEICLPVYYEQLILYPEWWMRVILNFLGVPWSSNVLQHDKIVNTARGATLSKFEKSTDQVLQPLQQHSLWNWSKNFTRMSPTKLRTLAPMLDTLGYDVMSSPPVYAAMSPDVKNNILHLTENKYFYRKRIKSVFDKLPYSASLPVVNFL